MRDYSAQATPQVINTLGWETILTLTDNARTTFNDSDFYPLVKSPNGSYHPQTDLVKVVLFDLTESINRQIITYPYLDPDKIKVIYVQFNDEDITDSLSVPEGQNRVKNYYV